MDSGGETGCGDKKGGGGTKKKEKKKLHQSLPILKGIPKKKEGTLLHHFRNIRREGGPLQKKGNRGGPPLQGVTIPPLIQNPIEPEKNNKMI